MRALLLWSAVALAVAGCDDEPPGADGGPGEMDAGVDAARPDGGPPPMCTPECDPADTCCRTDDGTACFDLRNDPTHCGGCMVNCLNGRGDACRAMQCECGDSPLGCQGTEESWCCPPRTPGGLRYCANLARSAADCGECGRGCDPTQADHCDGGRCICGDERSACDGTPESMCCAESLVDVSCVDTTTDGFHCGACGVLCQGLERCENGACTRGAACDGGCELGEVCCDGTCCERSDCLAGRCGELPDAGPPDAGPPDAGTDAG